MRLTKKSTIKIKNRIFAKYAELSEIPPKPKMPATNAITRKITAQRNIIYKFKFKNHFPHLKSAPE
jgi:hypothetical protein